MAKKITKTEEIQELIDEIKTAGFEKVTFSSGDFYIKDKNDYSFHVYFVYNSQEFQSPTFDEIVYNLKDRVYSLSRNQKELKFSEDNLRRSFGLIQAEQLGFLEVPGNEGFYSKCFNKIACVDYERTKMVSRFLIRLIEEYPVLERIHKAGFDISKCFQDVRDFKTTSILEAFNFETKAHLKAYKTGKFRAYYLRSLSDKELQLVLQMQDWCKEFDHKYGLDKTDIILQMAETNWGGFSSSTWGSAFENLEKIGRKPDKKRLVEYIGYEVDVRQGLTSPRRALDYFVDYLRMSCELGTKYEKYPRYLVMRHDIATKYYNIVANGDTKEKFIEVCKKVAHLEGKIGRSGWSIVIPKDPMDLVDEGEQLSHCVKSYIETIANGECNIVFLRKNEDLDTAVYTVEIRDNAIVQFAGYGNCDPDDDAKKAIHTLAESFNLVENYE